MSDFMEDFGHPFYIFFRGVVYYKEMNQEQLGDELKNDIEAAAKKYVYWKKEKSSILTIFQGIRLFELIGESGPQAILHVSIALRIGYTNWFQVRGIINKIIFLYHFSYLIRIEIDNHMCEHYLSH